MNIETTLMCSIREYLEIPEVLRAIDRKPIYKKTRETRKMLEHKALSDTWANIRKEELRKQGIYSQTRRFRRNEPLCVVYQAI